MSLDGVRVRSRHVRMAWAGGITQSVIRPLGTSLISGLGSAFRTCCGPSLLGASPTTLGGESQIVREITGLHVTVGNAAKNGGISASISGQISVLRSQLDAALSKINSATTNVSDPSSSILATLPRSDPMWPWVNVIQGAFPLYIEVNQADAVLAILRLYSTYQTQNQNNNNFNLTLIGCAECGVLGIPQALSKANVGVLLFSRVLPDTTETSQVTSLLPSLLQAAGVRWGLSTGDTDNARNLRWEAGWNMMWGGITEEEAVRAVTSSVATLYNLPSPSGQLLVGQRADFTVLNGAPFSLQSHVKLVATAQYVDCNPPQR